MDDIIPLQTLHNFLNIKTYSFVSVCSISNVRKIMMSIFREVSHFAMFSHICILMVSIYLSFGLPLGLTHCTSMSSTVLVIWLSSLRLTGPYQRSRVCIRCVVIGSTVASFLISLFPMSSLRLTHCIHRNI